MRSLLVPLLLATLTSCVVTAHQEPWAPVQLSLDTTLVHPDTEVFVYVDDVYRGNFVNGAFRVYLTLEPHDLRVHLPVDEPWEQRVTLTRADYPQGRSIVVSPPQQRAD